MILSPALTVETQTFQAPRGRFEFAVQWETKDLNIGPG